MIRKYLKIWKFESYQANLERINDENRIGIELILIFYTIIVVFNLIGQSLSGWMSAAGIRNMIVQIIYLAAAHLIYFIFLRKRKNVNYTRWIYICEIPILVITMIHGTFYEPDQMTFSFFLFLLLLPMLILDKPWRIALFIILTAGVYAVMACQTKNPELLSKDVLHLFNVSLMSVSASLYTLSARIRNIEYAGYFAEKAVRDPLTGLYNRAGAFKYIDPKKSGILVYIDLDNFKEFNDTYGHAEGDWILRRTADALRSDFRRSDTLVRLGGDEFVAYAEGVWERQDIEKKLAELEEDIRQIRDDSGRDKFIQLSVSMGCVSARNGAESVDQMLRLADREMYRVKRGGKGNYHIIQI